jgi:poly(A) polymerase
MTQAVHRSPREGALDIVRRLQAAGHEAYWVGGCVRDVLLGRQPQDYDVATSALPAQLEALFRKTIPVGRKFGVVIVRDGRHQFQVATFRAETDYQDGRHPERVAFGEARADASRRDFTINGLYFDPVRDRLHDWVEGAADLRAHIVRTVGPPGQRFAEDHLRLLRAVRFAAQLDFQIAAGTLAALQATRPRSRPSAPSGSATNCSRSFVRPTPRAAWNCSTRAACWPTSCRKSPPPSPANKRPTSTPKAASSITCAGCSSNCPSPRPTCCPGPSCCTTSPSR